MKKSTNRILISAAIMGLMSATLTVPVSAHAAKDNLVLCKGANSCSGKGGCGESKGKNSCEGKGNALTTKAECDKKGMDSMPVPHMRKESKKSKKS